MSDVPGQLLWLSHEIGREDRQLAILGEGNCSAKLDDRRFLVKASGAILATLQPEELTECHTDRILALVDMQVLEGVHLERSLMEARVDHDARRPSIESAFHCWLLQLEGVNFVGHCHPVTCNQILCSPRAEIFAGQRMFPDEVVCCGPQSIFVPYTEPGILLAREIRSKVLLYMRRHYGRVPRLILLQNHGIIALGPTAHAVLGTTLMTEKAARIYMGASLLGGPSFLPPHQVQRLDARPDEALRRRQLQM